MKKNQIILIIGILILIGLVLGFIYWQKFVRPGAEVSAPGQEEETEVSQEEAINIALRKYPGEIRSIVKKEIASERNIPSSTFWLIEIALEEPMFFEKINKEIKIIQVKVTMDKNIDIYELVE